MKFFKRHKILTALLLVVLLFGLAAAWFIWDKLDRIDYHDGTLQAPVQSVQAEDAPEEEAAPPILTEGDLAALPETETVLSDREIEETEDVFNILLLGTDERADGYSENARADSIMLLSVDKKNAGLRLVSLQRGMGVPILEGEYEGSYDWLTHCFRYGGADLMLKEVQHCLRVEVDRYVRVNFDSFRQVIDAVGGVEITLTAAEAKGAGSAGGGKPSGWNLRTSLCPSAFHRR